MRKIFLVMLLLLIPCLANAQLKISELTADTSPTTDDLTVTVNDPAGTPATRKVTIGNLLRVANLPSGATLDTEWDTIGEIETATSVNIIVSTEIDTVTEINALTTDNDVATLAGSETLTNKTIAAGDNVITADDTICTDCLNATEIEDIYTLNSGDTITGAVTINDNGGTGSTLLTIGDANDADSVVIFGDLTVTGDDITMGTNTSGHILVADGTNFNPVAMSGDVTIDSTGATTIGADKVALTTDTTGNYVATIADSGASEVTVANSGTENAAVTLAIASGITRDTEWDTAAEINTATTDNDFVLDTASIDWGGKTSFEIPNGASPTVDAFGEIAGDNDLWAASRGAPVFFDGTASTALVNVLVSDPPSNGQVPKWNTGGTITWEDDTQSAGAATAWDDIADPDAAASINFAGFDQDVTSAEDGGDILTITNSDADRAADSIILNLSDNDGADANAIYLRMIGDADGTPTNDYTFAQDGFTSLLTVTAPTLTLSGTGTINGLDSIDATTETTLEAALDIAGDVSGTGLGSVAIGADKVTEAMLKAVDTASDEDIFTYESTTGDFEWHTMDQMIANMSAGSLPNDSILEADFKAVDAASDEECLTYETTTGDFEWQTCGSGTGDVTSVGDCATGDCFTGASGTTLTSNTDLIMALDEDNNGTESFQVLDGANATVFEVAESGLITTLVGIDAIGAVDMDYGSADVTDHTFITDGTGDAEIVLPDSSIGTAEILADAVTEAKLKAVDAASDEDVFTYESTTGDFEWHSRDEIVAGISAGALPNDSILEADFKAVDAASDEECLTYETTTGDFEWQTCGSGGGGATEVILPIYSAKITGAFAIDQDATQGAQIDAGDGNWRLLFDATTDEGAVWQFRMPNNYSSTPVLKIQYTMASATANEVEFEGAIMCVTDADAADVATASFSAIAVGSATVPGTAGYMDEISITLTDDSCAAADAVWVYLSTDSDDATNDDATGDREVINVSLSYTGA